VVGFIGDAVDSIVGKFIYETVKKKHEVDEAGMLLELGQMLPTLGIQPEDLKGQDPEVIRETIHRKAVDFYEGKEKEFGAEVMREIERVITLRTIDQSWIDHLNALDHLKEGVGLRGYAQVEPIVVYAQEAFELFDALKASIGTQVISQLFKVQLREDQEVERKSAYNIHGTGRGAEGGVAQRGMQAGQRGTLKRAQPKVGRNDPCPCGSGKKYKQCCGKAAAK
jgi:preprotein translocase subunit SecA